VGDVVERFLSHRLPMMPFPDLGLTFVHRDDVAAGVLLALDAGRPGAEYILGGEIATMRDVVETVARLTGRTAPTRRLPTGVLKAVAPVAPVLGRLTGLPRIVREIVSSSDRVTFWVTDRKARRELGYSPRSLEDGMRDTYAGR
jgi:dihydroflavonol-4-reductase